MGRRENDLRTLRRLLQELAERLPMSHRQIEERLHIGHGNLNKLFNGMAELHVRHILGFAELLGVSPGELLDLGCPETTAAATRRLEDLLPSLERAEKKTAMAHLALPVSREELADLLREEIRRELAARGLGDPPLGSGGEPE